MINIEKWKKLRDDNKGSAIGFVIGMFVLILVAVNLVPSIADTIDTAQNNASVASFSGVTALAGILVVLFVILPLVVVAKAV